MKTSDKTIYKNMSLCSFGNGANLTAVDSKDGKIVRMRPVHYDEHYTKEDLNYWTINAKGHSFEPGMKTLNSPFTFIYKTRTYSPNRVPFPLKRVDWDPNGERNPQNRGKSKYERISWDEATDIIASEIVRIDKTYGRNSIFCQGDGHGETGSIHGPHGTMANLLDMTGGLTMQARQPDSWEGWYWGAKHAWGNEPLGQNTHQHNLFKDISENSDAVLFWGCDPETTPWGWSGQQASRLCFWFSEIGVEQIHIAPDVNYANAVHADRWIPVLPNTDAALQLAIAYVWMTEGTYDKDYVESHTEGFDWFEYYVLGNEDGVPKTPEWAEEKCHVPAYRIKALARYWASHNLSIGHCNGGSYIRSCYSHEPARLEVYLLAMQAVGKPGRNQVKFIEWALIGMDSFNPLPPGHFLPEVRACYHGSVLGELPASFIPKTLVPQCINVEDGEKVEWYGHTTSRHHRTDQFKKFQFPQDGDHGIKMIWSDSPCWSTCWNGGNEFQDALLNPNLEFFLVQHPWMENDTLFADMILPISTTLELDDFGVDTYSGQFNSIIWEQRACDRQLESLSDYEAVVEVAKKLQAYGGIYEDCASHLTGDMTVEEWQEVGYQGSGLPEEEQDLELIKRQGYQMLPTREGWDQEPAGMIEFYEDPVNNPMETPTGKIEFYSTGLANFFPDDEERQPVAKWIEESETHHERISCERAKDYPFLLVSNHPRWRIHANFDDCPWTREIETCKVVGVDGYAYEPVWIHPADAARLGIENGDIVEVFNERGTVLGGAYVTERVIPGAVLQDHGAETDPIVPGVGGIDRGGANNLIAPSATSSKNAAGEVTGGFLVGVRKCDIHALMERYPEAFEAEHYTIETGTNVYDCLQEA